MPTPKTLSYVGFARETTPGTAVAPSVYVPIRNLTPSDKLNYVPDQGLRGSMVDTYDQLATQKWSEYNLEGDVFVDTVGYILKGLLGDETITGGAAPYSHAISVLNTPPGQPPSYTITDFNGFNARAFAFGMFSDFEFKFQADQLLTYTAKAMAFGSATASTPTQSFSALAPKQAWTGSVSIGGSSTSLLSAGDITVSRSVTPVLAVNGTQSPYKIWSGAVMAKGTATIIYESDTFLNYYLNGTTNAFDVTFTSGTGATTQTFEYHATKALFTSADITRQKDYIELSVAFECVANTTDAGASGGYSPCLVTLANALSAAY